MKKDLWLGIGVLVLAGSVEAQPLNIVHQPVACAVADRFPRLEARISPPDTVAVARVLFQGATAEWYSVVMKPDGSGLSGVLPKPKKSLKAFRYYIEATDKALGTSRTPEYQTSVVGSSGECKGRIMGATVASASVLLQGPVGVAAIPAGFASSGVVAAGSAAGSAAGAAGATSAGGGGLSGGAVAGIVGGVGAAAAGVAVVAGKGGDESPSGPTGTSFSGSISGQLSLTLTGTGGGGQAVICGGIMSLSGTMKVVLGTSSTAANGQAETTLIETQTGKFGDPGCGSAPGPKSALDTIRCSVTGTPGSMVCSVQRVEGGGTLTFSFAGALSAGVISGTVSYGRTDDNGRTTGSTTFPVSLR